MSPMKASDAGVIAVNHEPLSFLRRAGHASVDQERRFLADHDPRNVERLAENGCDLVRTHFFKGFGLLAEREEMEMTRALVRDCHRVGLKVQLYVQFGTLVPETILEERPDALSWVQEDGGGKPITLLYGHQTYRCYPCFNRPGYWEYLDPIVSMGIVEYGADAIGFDNVSTAEEPSVCHCPECGKAFRAFLKGKYRPDTPEGARATKERFGHAVLDHILPPAWNYFNHPYNLASLRDPVQQEWVLFRCESLRRTVERLSARCRALRSDVLLEYNAYKSSGSNTAFIHGIWLPDLAAHLDAFWNECDPYPGFTEDGRLLHKARGFLMGRALGRKVFTSHPTDAVESAKLLAYGESMAFGGGLIGGVGSAEDIYAGRETAFRALRSFRARFPEAYRGTSGATVAVFESKPSLSFANFRPHFAKLTAQQGLLQGHCPFDLVFSLDGLDARKALVLPDVECLNDREIETLLAFVRIGGGLLVTDETGEFDHWRRPRGGTSLCSALGLPTARDGAPGRMTFGAGRAAWFPRLESEAVPDMEALCFKPFSENQPTLDARYWRAPRDLPGFMDAVRWVAGGSLPVEAEAPRHVLLDFQKAPDGGDAFLHLLNYRHESPEDGIRARIPGPPHAAPPRVTCLDPQSGKEDDLTPDAGGWIRIPMLRVYLVVRFHFFQEHS